MEAPSPDYLKRFADALVDEIKALRSRRGIPSSRALGELLGEDPQWVSNRLDGGNPRTGERVSIGVSELVRIADVLGTSAQWLIEAADKAARTSMSDLAGKTRSDYEAIAAEHPEEEAGEFNE